MSPSTRACFCLSICFSRCSEFQLWTIPCDSPRNTTAQFDSQRPIHTDTYRLRLLCDAAVEAQPEFAHAFSPGTEHAPPKALSLQARSSTTFALRVRNGRQNTLFHCVSVLGVRVSSWLKGKSDCFFSLLPVLQRLGSRSVGGKEPLWSRACGGSRERKANESLLYPRHHLSLSFKICNTIRVNITQKANTESQQFHKLNDLTNYFELSLDYEGSML